MTKKITTDMMQSALRDILGDDDLHVPSPGGAYKLQDGTRVYRIVGNFPHLQRTKGGGISVFNRQGDAPTSWLPVNSYEELKKHKAYEHVAEWQYLVVKMGPEVVEAELAARLQAKCDFPVVVEVGRNGARQSSIAVKLPARKPELAAKQPTAIELLFSRLPPAGSDWPPAERAKWFEQANTVFDLMYPEEKPFTGKFAIVGRE